MRIAAMFVALAACGKPHALVDGGNGDGQSTDGGVSGTAHVIVHVKDATGDGSPVPGARVEAGTAAGAIVATTMTAADGSAAIEGPNGGMIVVTESGAVGAGQEAKVVIAGVKDGDVLEIGAPVSAAIGTATLSFPSEATAKGYTVSTGCGSITSGVPGVEVDLHAQCAGPHTIVVAALHGTSAPAYLVAPGITLDDGDDVALTGSYTAALAATIGVTGMPADGDPNTLDVGLEALADQLIVSDSAGRPVLAGGAGSLSMWAPQGAGDRQLVFADYLRPGQQVFVYQETALGDATFDLATRLPEIARTGAGSWTLGAGDADGIYGNAQFHDAATGVTGALTFVLPPDATTVPLPDGVTIDGTPGRGWIVESNQLDYDTYRQTAATGLAGVLVVVAHGIPRDLRLSLRYF